MKKFIKSKVSSHPDHGCAQVIGMDIGDKFSELVLIDAGNNIRFEKVRTRRDALCLQFSMLPASRVAMEACTHSPWISRQLVALGHEVIVANPRKLRLIAESRRKNDKRDAEMLARLARSDEKLLSPIKHRSEASQFALIAIRSRDALVKSRTQQVNSVRSLAKSLGFQLPKCDSEYFAIKAREALEGALLEMFTPQLDALDALSRAIEDQDRKIGKLCEARIETQCLRQVPGVGPITSLCFVLTLDDKRRFKRSRDVGAYLGLAPAQRQSSGCDPQLRISKEGDSMLRRLLVSCAQLMLQKRSPDTALKRFGLRLSERGGKSAKKKAAVAVARKLAVLLHRLWVTGEVYEPLRGA